MTTPSYFKNNLRLSKERFTKSIFKFNCNYNEHAPLELVQSFVKNKQGVSLKSNRVLHKSYDNENQQMELYLKKYDKKEGAFKVKYNHLLTNGVESTLKNHCLYVCFIAQHDTHTAKEYISTSM